MASRKDIEAGKAHVTLYAKDSPLMKGLSAVSGKLNAWGKGLMIAGGAIAGLGGAITASLMGAVSVFTEMGSQLDDVANRTQLPISMIAELGYAAEQSGTSMETLEKALIAMQKNGLNPQDFDAIATSIAGIEDPVARTQAAMKAFGKSGAELLPMLADIVQLREEARGLGLVPTDDAVKKAAALGDAFDKVRAQIMASIFEIGAALSDVFLPALKLIQGIGTGVIKWLRENKQLVILIAGIGTALTFIGGIVMAIGAGFIAAAAVVSGISFAISTLGPILAAVFSPVGAIVLAVAAIGAGILLGIGYWLLFTKHGQATLQLIKAGFVPIMKGIQGIGDALMAGDIELAGKIAATGLKLAFFSAIDAIVDRILTIPVAIIDAMKPLAQYDPTGLLAMQTAAAEAALNLIKAGSSGGSARKEYEQLLKEAADKRQKYEDEQESRRRYGAMMKSLGSFDANALTLQNWGTGGDKPNARIEKWLEQIFGGMNRNTEETVKAIERASPNWGE